MSEGTWAPSEPVVIGAPEPSLIHRACYAKLQAIPEADREERCKILRPDFVVEKVTWFDLENKPVEGLRVRYTHEGKKYALAARPVAERSRQRLVNSALLAIFYKEAGL